MNEFDENYRAPGPQPRAEFEKENPIDRIKRLDALPEEARGELLGQYEQQRKKVRTAFICWVIPPGWHYFYLGRTGRGLLMLLSVILPLIWLAWWVVEATKMHERVEEHNGPIAEELLQQAEAG